MEQVLKKEKQIQAKPIMKWAGGKTQMLGDIMPKIPQKYGKYIEPFIGGGALFFALSPDKAIIADSNPELINMYRQVADNVEAVISYLKKYKNTKEDFYEVRSLDWFKLKKEEAAAPAPAPVPVAAAPVQEETDNSELIAVIAAAIAASEGTTTDGFVVRSIRKINRKKR